MNGVSPDPVTNLLDANLQPSVMTDLVNPPTAALPPSAMTNPYFLSIDLASSSGIKLFIAATAAPQDKDSVFNFSHKTSCTFVCLASKPCNNFH